MLKKSIFNREKPYKRIKYKENKEEGRHLVKHKPEKEYEYYICDYCGKEIRILEKKYEMTGGVAIFPESLTKKGDLKLALCNKCLNPVLQEFEKS